MSQEQLNNAPNHLKSAYTFISLILFAPVLLWPTPMLIFDNPMLSEAILPKWYQSIILLLIFFIAVDVLLFGVKTFNQAVYAAVWVSIISMLILQNQNNAWLLSFLFLLHSLRSAYFIFTKNKHAWWFYIAWSRDITTSLTIFIWINII